MILALLIAILLSLVAFTPIRVYRYAHKVTAVTGLELTLDNGNTVLVPAWFITRYSPLVGKYYVVRGSGEECCMTVAEFERDSAIIDG